MMNINAHHYLKIYTACTFCLILIVGFFNLLVDPFWLFDSPKIKGFNADKTQYHKYTRMEKAHRIRYLKPAGIILGTSRAELGIDPAHPGWNSRSAPIYNLALSSGKIKEIFLYLKHAHAINRLNQVVLGVDFFMFDISQPFGEGFDQRRLITEEDSIPSFGWIEDIVESIFSFDALWASIKTIQSQKTKDFVPYLENGFREHSANWHRIKKAGGHRAALISNMQNSLIAEDGWTLFTIRGDADSKYPSLDTFRDLLRFCIQEEINLLVFISPVHAMVLEARYQMGLWKDFELWKTELTHAVSTLSAGTSSDIQLWDFTGYNGITTEPFPPYGDRTTQMQWYWEGSHYKKETGDLILDRIFKYKSGHRTAPNWFGVQLTTDMIDSHLNTIRMQRAQYILEQSDDVEEITNLVKLTEDARKELRNRHLK